MKMTFVYENGQPVGEQEPGLNLMRRVDFYVCRHAVTREKRIVGVVASDETERGLPWSVAQEMNTPPEGWYKEPQTDKPRPGIPVDVPMSELGPVPDARVEN